MLPRPTGRLYSGPLGFDAIMVGRTGMSRVKSASILILAVALALARIVTLTLNLCLLARDILRTCYDRDSIVNGVTQIGGY